MYPPPTILGPISTHLIFPGTATAPVPAGAYLWEDRPAYVEPDPTAGPGSPAKILADDLGLTSRITVNSIGDWNTATTTSTPGTQVYVATTITGDGLSTHLSWYGTNNPIGTTGTAVDGTPANPILITCAPGIWIDGGQTPGTQNLNSRALQFRGVNHVGLYGANIRRATFVCKFDQCHGTAGSRIIVQYCEFAEAGHNLFHIGGYHTPAASLVGESSYFDVRYNEIHDAGLGDNRFGEGIYVGYGSGPLYTTSRCHHVDAIANHLHDLPAESFDAKAGGYDLKFNYNLITDCGDSLVRTGGAANEGYPGACHLYPAPDSLYPGGYASQPAGHQANTEVIGNRFLRITSAADKFPSAQVIIAHRDIRVVGNIFEACSVPGSRQIRTYIEDGQSFGTFGTIEIANNSSKDARTLRDHFIGGGSNPTEDANAQNNTNASSQVGTSAQTGVDLVVSAGDFGDDGTGNEGFGFVPVVGGALDVTGADTSSLWSTDYAGTAVAVPVKPGARQDSI